MPKNRNIQIQQLTDTCIDVLACAQMDYEVDIRGNSSNASEVQGLAMEVLDFFEIDFKPLVDAKVLEYEREYA